MSKPGAPRRGLRAVQLLEDAVRLLRRAPAPVFVFHLLGSVPCLLYGIYCFTDLSRSAFAADRVIGASLGMAALYAWMKCWQAISAAHLNAALLGKEPPAWEGPRLARLIAAQVLFHPFGLLLRMIAGTIVLPYLWVSIFCQNITVLGDGTPAGVREVISRSLREALRWPLGAHALAVQLGVFGFFIYLNLLALMFAVPFLLKTFFGLETIFSRYMMGLFNPTALLAVLAASYLIFDPIRKAAVLLRCFHGRSLQTGEDLAVEMQNVRRASPLRIAALVLALCCLQPMVSPARAEPARVEASQLDRSIDEVLDRSEFAWRAPRAKAPDAEKMTGLQRWLRDANAWAKKIAYRLGQTVKRWIKSLFGPRGGDDSSGDSGSWMTSAQTLIWVTIAITVIGFALLIYKRWSRPRTIATTAEAVPAAPDLREENVTADLLPEERWLQLAAELFDRGELRLALRAFYLAGLAHLNGRELLQLARHKSNRDYERELRRRVRAQPELLAAFGKNLDAFERAWYGDHAVTRDGVGEVSANFERIRTC